MGMSYSDVDVVAKAIPTELSITIEEALKQKELQTLYESSPQIKTLIDTAKALVTSLETQKDGVLEVVDIAKI